MEKRKWLWKKRPSEKSPGECESSESTSSQSARYSDDQEALKASPDHDIQSAEVTSKVSVDGEEVNDSIKSLTEKLSAALVNVSAKEDLVKQHSRVAEEAVQGWEKAENELAAIKRQHEVELQKNVALENRVSHLDGALKECVRQLRQAREEQEERLHEAVEAKSREWERTKIELENRLLHLQNKPEAPVAQSPVSSDSKLYLKLESLEKENSAIKAELLSHIEELEVRTIERDLSAQAAETASKQHLESIKKVAKLEAECRRLQAVVAKSSLVNNRKLVSASSINVESVTDSESGNRTNPVEIECEPSCSDSWASALIAELDQFKNDQAVNKNAATCSFDIDIMDFLEMERLASLPEIGSKNNENNSSRTEQESMIHRVEELEEKLKKIEAEKDELENALSGTEESLRVTQVQLMNAETRLEELQRELIALNESKKMLEDQLVNVESEARAASANFDMFKEEVEKERSLSAEMVVKCQRLEDELMRKTKEVAIQQTEDSNAQSKIKQEDVGVAAGKLAECQKTIASLGKQLKSLATLEDFLIDTANIPGFSNRGSMIAGNGEKWKSHCSEALKPRSEIDFSEMPRNHSSPLVNGSDSESPPSSSSSSTSSSAASVNRVGISKSRNGFGKLFTRGKSGIQLENPQG